MTGRRIILTGATGYLGRKVAAALVDRHDHVSAIVRSAGRSVGVDGLAEPIPGDLPAEAFTDAVVGFGPTDIIHVAADGGLGHGPGDIAGMLDANIGLGVRLLDAAASTAPAPTFLGIGTFWQLGLTAGGRGPNSLYTASKAALAEIARHYSSQSGLTCRFLLPTDIYGPEDGRGRLLSTLRDHIRTGEVLRMTAGEQLVSFVHVDDVVASVIATLEIAPTESTHESYLVAGPETATLRKTIEALIAELDLDVMIEWGARPYRTGEVMSFNRLPGPPGWEPRVRLACAFRELIGGPV